MDPRDDLTDRYLAAIASHLPKAKAQDITAELRDLLLSQREEKEAELGRPLTPDEAEAMIKAFGHPLRVAARYDGAQYLIGPALYPYWWAAVKVVAFMVSAVMVTLLILDIVFAAGSSDPILPHVIGAFWSSLFGTIGALTILFAILERYAPHVELLPDWSPRRLYVPLEKPQTRWNRISELTLQVVLLLWWVGVLRLPDPFAYPYATGHGGAVALHLSETWRTLYWPVIGFVCLGMAANLLALIWPARIGVRTLLRVAATVIGVFVLGVVYRHLPLVTVTAVGLAPKAAAGIQSGVDIGIRIGLLVGGVALLVETLRDLYRLWRRLRATAPADRHTAAV
ncbi:MAG: hypothetical protein ACHP84_15705 [Caulobacterales bacterium]